ncbi:MAG: M20 aminoacylase family protein [Pseudomonadota bacterium]
MAVINRIAEYHGDLTAWRHHLHQHPELGFEEVRTSAFVAEKLHEFGCDEVHVGIATTGVVGVVHGRRGDPATGRKLALRCDMDALPLEERTGLPYASQVPGRMHACGHDGHTTMLLGAARYLAETRNFHGTVYLIFQPGEEGFGGGRVMVEEGLFERFPAEAVFGMHNWPGAAVGSFAICKGPIMAATDTFAILIKGKGGHAALPHTTVDPILAASAVVQGLQGVVARNVPPKESAVVSVTRIAGGDAYNVIPEAVELWGTVRTYTPELRTLCQERLEATVAGVARGLGCVVEIDYRRGYPPTVNSDAETDFAADVAEEVVGPSRVNRDATPSMGGEDFAYMLQQRPGAYILMGNGPGDRGRVLHSPHYDFNDEALPVGVSYWVRLAERFLGSARPPTG